MYSEGLITVIPMVKTRKKVPISSATRARTFSISYSSVDAGVGGRRHSQLNNFGVDGEEI
jgi:hypothetical protein